MVECAECGKAPKLPEWLKGWRHSLDGETSICPGCRGFELGVDDDPDAPEEDEEDDNLVAGPTRCWE